MENLNSCPWENFSPATIRFCEESICSWIKRPSETWSNLIYILVGILILFLVRRENKRHLSLFGYLAILLGIFSGIFHASDTFFGELLDLSSMYLIVIFCITLELKRLIPMPRSKFLIIFLSLSAGSIISLILNKTMGIIIFIILFGLGLFTIRKVYHMQIKKGLIVDYAYFKKMAYTILIAWGIWWTDYLKILCVPENHILTGHAIWHLMTGVCIYYIYKFFAQFDP
jgi:hypothetical protein